MGEEKAILRRLIDTVDRLQQRNNKDSEDIKLARSEILRMGKILGIWRGSLQEKEKHHE
mgnify:CR=1 FL=1